MAKAHSFAVTGPNSGSWIGAGRAEVDKVPPAKPVEDRPEGGTVVLRLGMMSREV
jgi:hypothetical protein